jgi:hypothetical protein
MATVPHFCAQDDLKAFLNVDQVTQLFAKIPATQQESQFAYADSVIADATGVQPADADSDPILVSIAARIIIWMLSGVQQWNDANKPELDRREKLYNTAIMELEDYEVPSDDPDEELDSEPEAHGHHHQVHPW